MTSVAKKRKLIGDKIPIKYRALIEGIVQVRKSSHLPFLEYQRFLVIAKGNLS